MPVLDASVPSPPLDDAGPRRGLPHIQVTYSGEQALSDYAIRVPVDMRSWMAPYYVVEPDCSNLTVEGPDGPLPFWVQEPTCGQEDGVLWVRIPELVGDGSLLELSLQVNDSPALPSDGQSVFRHFWDFNQAHDWAEVPPEWVLYSQHALEQNGDGQLRFPEGLVPHMAAMRTMDPVVRSGADVVGARFRSTPRWHDDFELGVGWIDIEPPFDVIEQMHREYRSGTWFSAVHYDSLGFSSGSGVECFWDATLPVYTLDQVWYEVEYHYQAGDRNLFQLTQDIERAHVVSFLDEGCSPLPEELPILVVFDHRTDGLDEASELDWLYVRPHSDVAPVVSLR